MQELIRLAQLRDQAELKLCSIIGVIHAFIAQPQEDADGENIRDYWKHLGNAD